MSDRRLRGTELHPDDQRQVLSAFVHRLTTETRRRWPGFASKMIADGYRVPEQSDAEWLAATMFVVTKGGRLDRRVRFCETRYHGPHEIVDRAVDRVEGGA